MSLLSSVAATVYGQVINSIPEDRLGRWWDFIIKFVIPLEIIVLLVAWIVKVCPISLPLNAPSAVVLDLSALFVCFSAVLPFVLLCVDVPARLLQE